MHNGGEVCVQSLKTCKMTKYSLSRDGLNIDCLPYSLIIETYPIKTVCDKYRLQSGTTVSNSLCNVLVTVKSASLGNVLESLLVCQSPFVIDRH